MPEPLTFREELEIQAALALEAGNYLDLMMVAERLHLERLAEVVRERDALKARVAELENSWRCFCCDARFCDEPSARNHFGMHGDDEPRCCEWKNSSEADRLKACEEAEAECLRRGDALELAEERVAVLEEALRLADKACGDLGYYVHPDWYRAVKEYQEARAALAAHGEQRTDEERACLCHACGEPTADEKEG